MASKNEIENLKVPPHNIEAEQSVLGSLMLDKDAIIKIADIVKVGDFYKDDHNLIYEKMLSLYEEREPLDVLSVSNKLEEINKLDQVGGSSYLASLVNTVPSASNIVHYAKVVQKKATLRRLIKAAGNILEMGYKEGEDVQKILDEAEQTLFKVSQKYIKQDFIPIKSILESAFNRIDELHKDNFPILIMSWPDFKNQIWLFWLPVLQSEKQPWRLILPGTSESGKKFRSEYFLLKCQPISSLTV